MASDSQSLRLQAIEDELAALAKPRASSSEQSPDTQVLMAQLVRQAELLVDKATVQLELGHADTSRTAIEAASFSTALMGHARDDELHGHLAHLATAARVLSALAGIDAGDLVSARQLLRDLQNEGASSEATAPLEERLMLEQQSRAKAYERMLVDRQQQQENLKIHWTDAEHALNTMAAEIADRIAKASALARRIAHPDRFHSWLMERVDANLALASHRSAWQANEQEPDAEELLRGAAERGRDLQRRVFSSGELLAASSITLQGKQASDGALRWHREHGNLLGLPHPDDASKFGYPSWQFETTVRGLLGSLAHLHPWGRWKFFHTPAPALQNLTPLQALALDGGSPEARKATLTARTALLKSKLKLDTLLRTAVEDFVGGEE